MVKSLTHNELQRVLDYEPTTGAFRWRVTLSNRAVQGKLAGRYDKDGYRKIRVFGQEYRSARLAWFYMNGHWPSHEIDHVNLVRDDDRISNLREATHSQNHMNKPGNGKSGVKGVSWHKIGKKWIAQIKVRGKPKYLGLYDNIDAASAAYQATAKELHGIYRRG